MSPSKLQPHQDNGITHAGVDGDCGRLIGVTKALDEAIKTVPEKGGSPTLAVAGESYSFFCLQTNFLLKMENEVEKDDFMETNETEEATATSPAPVEVS